MSRKVLLVEDEDDIRTIAALSLELAGWEVMAVSSGQACLAAVAAARPDAVLLDVMMPGQDGPTTLAALRALPGGHDLPVLFLTAKAQSREREHLLGLGAQGVLAKPFDPMALAADIAAVLGWTG
jgi:CheY-like chemotaxis protein